MNKDYIDFVKKQMECLKNKDGTYIVRFKKTRRTPVYYGTKQGKMKAKGKKPKQCVFLNESKLKS